jgi:vacuolar-type H+-ATPase subunit H
VLALWAIAIAAVVAMALVVSLLRPAISRLPSRRGTFAVRVRGVARRKGGEMTDFWRTRQHRDGESQAEPDAPESAAGTPQDTAAGATPLDLAHVGDHIAKVLAAAEESAEKLRADADLEARQIRERAARAAEELTQSVEEEAQAERTTARRILEEAEATAAGLRADADEYVEERRRQADEQASLIVRDAERRATRIAETAADRHRVVLSNIGAAETRLTELAKSMRLVAGTLDEVVAAGEANGNPEEPTSAKTAEEVSSLEAALRPAAQTAP